MEIGPWNRAEERGCILIHGTNWYSTNTHKPLYCSVPPRCVRYDDLAERVCAYRGGYTAASRRQLEAKIFSGEILGVAATKALELGVNIVGMDVTILMGYPGSIASMWQQVGRAGRSHAKGSTAILVAFDTPLDQFLLKVHLNCNCVWWWLVGLFIGLMFLFMYMITDLIMILCSPFPEMYSTHFSTNPLRASHSTRKDC